MFDTGFWEFALIAVITLIVVGPDKMPGLAKTAGKYVGKLKNFIAQAKIDADEQFDISNIKKELSLGDNENDSGKVFDILDEVKESVKKDARDIQKSVKNKDE